MNRLIPSVRIHCVSRSDPFPSANSARTGPTLGNVPLGNVHADRCNNNNNDTVENGTRRLSDRHRQRSAAARGRDVDVFTTTFSPNESTKESKPVIEIKERRYEPVRPLFGAHKRIPVEFASELKTRFRCLCDDEKK